MSTFGGLQNCDPQANSYESRFIVGDEPFSNWDSYDKNINNMGVDKLIAVCQEVYDSYKKQDTQSNSNIRLWENFLPQPFFYFKDKLIHHLNHPERKIMACLEKLGHVLSE